MLTESLGALQRGVFLLSGELGASVSLEPGAFAAVRSKPPGHPWAVPPSALPHSSFGLCPH